MSLRKWNTVLLALAGTTTGLIATGTPESTHHALKRQTLYPPNTGLNSTSSSYTDAFNATIFAMTYGTPLLPFVNFIGPVLSSIGPNALDNENATATANGAAVIRPNVDTLYTRVGVDFSSSDLAITVPPITDGRFYIFPFYDIFGDNFANVGSQTNSTAGKYLMRRAADVPTNPGLQLSDIPSGYQGVINFPGSYGFLLIRILLRNNGSDVDTVHQYQSQITIDIVNRTTSLAPQAPPLTLALLNGSLTGDVDQQTLQLTARLAPHNLPEIRDELANITSIFSLAGISLANGTYTQPPSVNLTEAAFGVQLGIIADLSNPTHVLKFGGGWQQLIPQLSGDFGSDFAARAYVAVTGLAQLAATEALYPEQISESTDTTVYLGPHEATIFTFSAKPPVTGFWSLTAYGVNNYLIPNPLDVYAVGDRSNLTFADGSFVYGPGGNAVMDGGKDGSFQVLVQPADVVPPKNWTSNWLPAPAGGGPFSINLRWYGPTPALTNGSYVYPTLTNVTALTANGSSPSNTSTASTSQARSILADAGSFSKIALAVTVLGFASSLI